MADAVVVIDAIQFPANPSAAYREIARVLRPGGRVVLTCWEATERAMWTEAAALDPGDDPALQSFHEEGVLALAAFEGVRRVMASARVARTTMRG